MATSGPGAVHLLNGLYDVTGSIGLLGTEASNTLMQGCDTLLMIGSGFPYAEFLPKPGQACGVQIGRVPGMLGCAIRWRSTCWTTQPRH